MKRYETLKPESMSKAARLFGLLDANGRSRLLAGSIRRTLQPGETVCREGEVGTELFVLLSGTVSVSVDDFGTPRRVARLHAGQFFGEMAALTNGLRTATVTVEKQSDLLCIRRECLLELLGDFPKLRTVLGHVGVVRTEKTFARLSLAA